jgi:peptidoglycan/LPS O-acetylase OafA/YrhL
VPYLFFLNAFPGLDVQLWPFSGVWWSLATEAQFYLVLPLLPLFVRSPTARRVGVLLLVIYVAAYVGFLVASGPWTLSGKDKEYVSVSLVGRAPLFALGAMAAWLWDGPGRALRDGPVARGWFALAGFDVVLVSLFVLLGLLLQRVVLLTFDVAETTWFWWHLIEGGLWTAILLLLLFAPLRTKRLISNPVFLHLGRWSYSLYLIHFPIMWYTLQWLKAWRPAAFITWSTTNLLVAPVILAGCVALAALSYRLIERPFLVRKARIAERGA